MKNWLSKFFTKFQVKQDNSLLSKFKDYSTGQHSTAKLPAFLQKFLKQCTLGRLPKLNLFQKMLSFVCFLALRIE